MKIIKQIAVAAVAMTLIGTASAHGPHYGNYVGAVRPVGNVYYGPRGEWVPFAVGVLTGVVIQEVRRQPEVIYVPAPQPAPQRWVYVQSDPRFECAGGTWINGGYFCPRLVP